MRLVLIACLVLSPAAAASGPAAHRWAPPVHARTCPKPIVHQEPGEPSKLQKLNRLPPAEAYAAVYYTDGCPRRLIEAQGKARR